MNFSLNCTLPTLTFTTNKPLNTFQTQFIKLSKLNPLIKNGS
jgi:hypothetical protein